MMRWFEYDHLPSGPLQIVSKWCYSLAAEMDTMLPEGDGKDSTGLRKLLEAKDCFVRAQLEGGG